jgi:hypothetical protein
MDQAVQLDHNTGGVAVEVRQKAVDDLLVAKVQAAQLIVAQSLPKSPLLRSRLRPQFFRPLRLPARDLLASDNSGVRQATTSYLRPPRLDHLLVTEAPPSR